MVCAPESVIDIGIDLPTGSRYPDVTMVMVRDRKILAMQKDHTDHDMASINEPIASFILRAPPGTACRLWIDCTGGSILGRAIALHFSHLQVTLVRRTCRWRERIIAEGQSIRLDIVALTAAEIRLLEDEIHGQSRNDEHAAALASALQMLRVIETHSPAVDMQALAIA